MCVSTRSSLSSLCHLLSLSIRSPCQKKSCAPLASRLHMDLTTWRRGAAGDDAEKPVNLLIRATTAQLSCCKEGLHGISIASTAILQNSASATPHATQSMLVLEERGPACRCRACRLQSLVPQKLCSNAFSTIGSLSLMFSLRSSFIWHRSRFAPHVQDLKSAAKSSKSRRRSLVMQQKASEVTSKPRASALHTLRLPCLDELVMVA